MMPDDDPFARLQPIGHEQTVVPFSRPVGMDDMQSPPLDAYADEFPKRENNPDPGNFPELTDAERAAVPALAFRSWGQRSLEDIKEIEFVYSDFYARGYTSLTVAPPKVGKSMLALAEAVDIASGLGILTGQPRSPLRVLYYNAEDDTSVLDSRIAALLIRYGIKQMEIADTLFPVSGVDADNFYMVKGKDGEINEALFVGLEKFIADQKIDVLIFDPLQDLSRSPETNEVFRVLGQRLRRLANTHNIALGLVHHTRKLSPGIAASIDDARGGGALRGTARMNRLLVPMSAAEGVAARVENHRFYFRVADMEGNLAPPSSDVNRWFQKVSVRIPNGALVGAVEEWLWPDAFMGLSREDAATVRSSIAACDPPPRENIQAGDWAGFTIAKALNLGSDEKIEKARISSLLKEWVRTGVLAVKTIRDTRSGRDTNVIVPGDNNPMSEAS